MLAESNGRTRGKHRKKLLQQVLTIHHRRAGQVEAFAVKKIEELIAKSVLPTGAQIGLEIIEARNAVLTFDYEFPVEKRRTKPEFPEGAGDAGEPFGPVEILSG